MTTRELLLSTSAQLPPEEPAPASKKREEKKREYQGPPKLLRKSDVIALTGMSKTQIDDHVRRGDFPRGFKLTASGRIVVWTRATIDAYLAERMAEQCEVA